MSTIDWTKVRKGDPDPTLEEAEDDDRDCPEINEDNWFCTRVRGHEPPHVAGGAGVVIAVWP